MVRKIRNSFFSVTIGSIFCQLLLIIAFITLSAVEGFAQRSKDGAKVVGTANNVVNEYTSLTANAAAGATTITVANSSLNANGRFPGALAAGDLIMIIQLQGATISARDSNQFDPWEFPKDSSWGMINGYYECGNWEFGEVYSVPTATSITLDCPLKNNYTSAGKVVVARVPRYSSLTINAGGSITCDTWNGTIGGVCAIEVENNTVINAGGSIDITGKGFRGGALLENLTTNGANEAAWHNPAFGAEKGEGIAGYQTDYDIYGGMYCKGAPANGGGGGNDHNCGGGGGANAGDTSLWNGHGNPDNSVAGWTTAWNLQYAGFAAQTSSGGGQGGYSFSSQNRNATTTGPGNSLWGGDNRRSWGGCGGRPLDYSTGRLFLGGGGGSGDQNDNDGGAGGNGGALLYLMNYGTVSGAGQIISNGNNGVNATGTSPAINGVVGTDAAGGGGAGGTLVINSIGTVSGISLTANGGKGGDQILVKGAFYSQTDEGEGPGGGGGGGYIAISIGAPATAVNGGANGTTNSQSLTEFPPNGATKGGTGQTANVTNFIINFPNVTICSGQSATLNATLTGTVPGGTTIIWYDALVGGNVLGTGSSYTTIVLTTGTYTYYVGTCPGTYHQPVIVTVTTAGVASAGSDVTICSGSNTTLNASGGTSYVWTPATGLSNPNISNPVANPVTTTTYVVTATTSCGNATDTVIVTVNASAAVSISGNTTICAGGTTTLTASGGGNYSWTTGSTNSAITVSPTTNTTYSVFAGSGSCADTASVTVTVSSGLTASISGNTTICPGSPTTLTASGGSNYSWSTTATTQAITVSPTVNTTYSVIAYSGTCADTISITITISNNITASVTGNTTICPGSPTTLTASGGNNYSWSTTATTASITVSPTANTTYSVIASSGTCADTTSITITISNNITASISGNTTVCPGSPTTLTASGGNNYSWSTTATTAAITVSPTSTTTYSVIATSGTCSDTDSVTVTVINNVTANVSGTTTVCSGGSAVLTASGGTNYSWSTTATTSSITVTPTANTTYSVIVSSGTCADTASITVTIGSGITASISGNTVVCGGNPTTLTASGGSNYSWNTTATTQSIVVSPTANTTYTVLATSGSCTDTATVTVTVSGGVTASVTGGNTTICAGNSATLTASGGTNYAWLPGGQTTSVIVVAPTVTTVYTVTVSDNNGCTDVTNTSIIIFGGIVANITGPDSICSGTSATLSAGSGGTYSWSTGATSQAITASPTTTTSYTLMITQGVCSDTATTTLNVVQTPTAAVTNNTTICAGDAITLNATGGGNYSWTTGQTTAAVAVAPSSTTTYSVVTTNLICSDTASVTVTVVPSSSANISGIGICQGNAATLTASGGVTYSWSTGETTTTINPTTAGIYSVISYVGTCSDTASTTLVVNPLPNVNTSPDVTIISGQSTDLNASGGTTYVWDSGNNGANITVAPNSITVYCVTVYDNNNCYDTACVRVTVEQCTGALYLPNAFSPNGDGDNDSLQIYYRVPQCIETFRIILYNRWGEKVYETNDPAFRWNGVYNSGFLKETGKGGHEVYAYYLDATFVDGQTISKKGNISLVW